MRNQTTAEAIGPVVSVMRSDWDALLAENRELRQALEVWNAAWKTGRNEPMVVAYENAREAMHGRRS